MRPLDEVSAPAAGEWRRGGLVGLDHDRLVVAQNEPLRTPRRHGPAALAQFGLLDAIYGGTHTLSKFRMLDVACVPYRHCEQVADIAISQP